MNKILPILAVFLMVGSLSAAFTISGVTYANQVAINCSLMDDGVPFVVNGQDGFSLGGHTQIVHTQCHSNLSLYYNNYTSYVIGNNTTAQFMSVELGNGTDNSSSSVYQYAQAIYYMGNSTDVMGAYNFTTNNGTVVSGLIGNAENFTENQEASILSTLGIVNGSMSMSAWVYPYTVIGNSNKILIALKNSVIMNDYMFAQDQYFSPAYRIGVYKQANNRGDYRVPSDGQLPALTWTKLTMTYDNTTNTLSFYINGTYANNTTALNGLAAQGTSAFAVNNKPLSSDNAFAARIIATYDQVEVYSTALNSSYILQSYNNEMGVPGYGLLASNETAASLVVLTGNGGSAAGNTSGFPVPSNQTINATASALYAFSNWSVTTGNCTVNNATNANTAVQVNDITQCTVQANFISACGVISTPMNYTLLNNVSITNSTCFNVTAANVSIDCNGYSMTGSNTTFKYGIFSNQFNTTIRNCNISNFDSAIVFYQSNNSSVTNSTLKTTCRQTASGIYPNLMSSGINLQQASYNTITNVTAEGYRGISLDVGANWNVGKNLILTAYFDPALSLQCTVSNNTFSNFITYSQDATGQSFGIAVNTGSDNKFYNFTLYNATDNLILEDVCTAYGGGNTKNNLFVNGTLISATKHLITYYAGTKTNNTFYWMNFSATTGNYVQNDPGGNWYNSSTEGNIYPDVQNGTTAIYGNVSSSFNPSFYIGIIGAKYPYNRTNSYGNKVSSTVTDWHPLTPYLILLANLTVNSGLGGTATGNNTSVITPINLSISATPSINYSFSNWSIINGTCTILNTSSNVTNVSITTNETCMVLASFLLNRYGTLTVLCGDGGYNCTGNSTDFIVPSNQTVSATSLSNFTFSYWTTVGNCSVISATTIQVDNGTCVATATFVYSTAYSNITPSPVLSSGLATCTYYYVSSNASNISVEFEWYKNFYLLLSGTATASPNISNTISSINNSSFAYDDLLLCQVRAIGGTWVPSSVVVVKTAVSPITTYSIPALISMFWNTWSWLFVAIFCLGISYIIFQPQIHTTMLSAGLLSFVAFAMTASVNQTNMTFIYEAIAYFALGLVLRFSGSK